jgi:hypothetical protein
LQESLLQEVIVRRETAILLGVRAIVEALVLDDKNKALETYNKFAVSMIPYLDVHAEEKKKEVTDDFDGLKNKIVAIDFKKLLGGQVHVEGSFSAQEPSDELRHTDRGVSGAPYIPDTFGAGDDPTDGRGDSEGPDGGSYEWPPKPVDFVPPPGFPPLGGRGGSTPSANSGTAGPPKEAGFPSDKNRRSGRGKRHRKPITKPDLVSPDESGGDK